MQNDILAVTKVYYATFAILLACITILSMAIAYNSLASVKGIEDLKLILLNDYEITQ